MSRRALFATVLLCGIFAATATAGLLARPPAGATALCNDGTYSYSQTRSGTCSHHGGVKEWLTPATPAGTPAAWNGNAGVTVLLAPRTRTSGCKLGPDPDRRCSPGTYYSKLTKAVLCSPSFHTSAIRNVSQSKKFAVEVAYGMKAAYYGSTMEIDHIVSLELGGSNDIANLYPEKATPSPGYHVKDRLENKLHALVCSGAMTLRVAQRGIARNWQALYAKVYGAAA